MDIDWNAARIATNAYNRKIDRQTLITERNAIKADLKNCELRQETRDALEKRIIEIEQRIRYNWAIN
jgi:hypothetical protein